MINKRFTIYLRNINDFGLTLFIKMTITAIPMAIKQTYTNITLFFVSFCFFINIYMRVDYLISTNKIA